MAVREDGVAEAVTFKSGDGGEVSGNAGVDFGQLGSTGIGAGGGGSPRKRPLWTGGGKTCLGSPVLEGVGFTELGGGGGLHPLDLRTVVGVSSASRLAHPPSSAGVRGVGSPPWLASPPSSADHVGGGADPAPAFALPAGGGDLRGREGDPFGVVAVRDMPANFRVAAGGDLGGMMGPQAALLAMILGAMTIIGEPDAPWPNQLGALLAWLGGCIALFLSWN